jgi:hypothetical protein
MESDLNRFFASYVEAYNHSLGESVDLAGIQKHFAECFIGAGINGVNYGRNDKNFAVQLEKGFSFYKTIGTQSIEVVQIDPTSIDDRHVLAKVTYRAHYLTKDSEEPITLEFDVSYLIQKRDTELKIFGFVTGDEMALYKEHGLIA